jgi:hypothetical protein
MEGAPILEPYKTDCLGLYFLSLHFVLSFQEKQRLDACAAVAEATRQQHTHLQSQQQHQQEAAEKLKTQLQKKQEVMEECQGMLEATRQTFVETQVCAFLFV